MGIHVALNHKTIYNYDRSINLSPQIVRLRPAPHTRTPVISYSMKVTPEKHFVNWHQDPFSNYLGRLVFPEKTRKFEVEVDLVAEMVIINPFDFFLEPCAETFPFKYEDEILYDLVPYMKKDKAGSKLNEYIASIDMSPRETITFMMDLIGKMNRDIRYLIRMEPNVQSPEKTLTLLSGSCRDSAWLLVNILRELGMASRFVSGYLIQLAADEKSLDGPSGPEKDFTDLHAWTEVFLPGAGWIGLDPTSGLFAGEGHIPLACSPEPQSAAPITGFLEECEVEFKHIMEVKRVFEAPRSTKPYPEEVWNEILELGNMVDDELNEGDVRLTMGGEPTFVSIDDMDGTQWNTEALGEEKFELSEKLFTRLKGKWAKGGLLHYGQGKWYPGEPLPRWALSCYFRKDGIPLWNDEKWLADINKDYGFTKEDAKRFLETLADNLDVSKTFICEAYEDILYYLYKERKLPLNLDPSDPKLDSPEERSRMIEVFEKGLGSSTGYVLPLQHGSWKSGPWPFRGNKLFLLPGDSPLGLRLPLDSLPWVSKKDLPIDHPLDPFAERPALYKGDRQKSIPGKPEEIFNESVSGQPKPFETPEVIKGQSAAWVVRTALCVQSRKGKIHIFMPPVNSIDGYLDLVAKIEKTAEMTNIPVIIEGYTPPFDPRINCLKITPDPGVIEVNIHPMRSWKEMVEVTTTLYETARESRLATEKFMLDGRHTGTGGGNHIVIGGETPSDSPFLRRPDLLRSFLTFWNNHPSLSYLFSGLFIGPTSQQPRIDEARHDSLYELEIAFSELERLTENGNPAPPWLVDRLFRHLLVDVTGNTHRAEFCIDKLYSPDSSSGRLGLVELRGFEMPPHAKMSLAQQLLIRTCVAWFWKKPYKNKLIHWGTRLHDSFMLPDIIRDDLRDVIDTLKAAGYPLSMDFFHPHFEFRFPIYGKVDYLGMELELRQALEPWNVLGEEPGGGGTARFVDSSVERLQVKVSGMTEDRYILTCNGRKVSLKPTDKKGVFISGVRYRAWQPPSCLHPTIGVHTPLKFDLFDTWNLRSIGGCSYHVGHPGGRSYEEFPVNANEAEGRRYGRFVPWGHTTGISSKMPEEKINGSFPYTLDLRY